MQTSVFAEYDSCLKETTQLGDVRRQECGESYEFKKWMEKESSIPSTFRSYAKALLIPKWRRSSRSRVASVEATFARLESKWRQETSAMSLVQHKITNMAYLQIIAMGYDALPFIFQQLQNRRRYWFAALEAITQDDSVVRPGSGFQEAVDAWLEWGRRHGYI
jgi:hypothetical protein